MKKKQCFCGKLICRVSKQCKSCSNKNRKFQWNLISKEKRKKSGNPHWKGNKVKTGYDRANRWFKKLPCNLCGNKKSEIHHIDNNSINNNLSNIVFLCRRHHMMIDGRLYAIKRW
mgnify:CR=1 FL=1